MIASFVDKATESIWQRRPAKRLDVKLAKAAYRKLVMLDAATTLDDLRVPPGNRLEALKGNRRGQYSIRVNDQWRICFTWKSGNAHDVGLADYH